MTQDPLPDEKKFILRLSSMFEGEFSLDWIEELTGLKASFILSILEEEVQNDILQRIKPAIYIFKKNQKKEWRSGFTQEEMLRLHKNIASVLMGDSAEDESLILEVTHHLLQFPNNFTECQWINNAGNIYNSRFELEKSNVCFKHLLENLLNLHGPNEDLLFIKAAISLSNGYSGRNQIGLNLKYLRKAQERARKLSEEPLALILELHIAKYERLDSEFNTAFRRFSDANQKLKALNDPEFTLSTMRLELSFLFWQGRFSDVIEVYEKFSPEVQKMPIGYFPILVAILVGHAYTKVGQLTQGLGLLDTLHTYCRDNGNAFLSAQASSTIATVMFEINNTEDTLRYLKISQREAMQSNNIWVKAQVALMLAIIWNKKDKSKATGYLKQFLKFKKRSAANLLIVPYILEVGWLIHQKEFSEIDSIVLNDEVERLLKIKSQYLQGLAYRYQAILGESNGWDSKKVIQTLTLSSSLLKKSGHQLEFIKTNFTLARYLLSYGRHRNARKVADAAVRILSSYNMDLIPDDLRPFIGDRNHEGSILDELLEMTEHVATKFDSKKVLQQIITTANRLTGAERGAILLIEKGGEGAALNLRASKNFTVEQLYEDRFEPVRKMIEEVIASGTGCILENQKSENLHKVTKGMIRSNICVPLIFKDKVVGALYHDNCLLTNVFKKSDLKLLGFFSAFASLCLVSENAEEKEEKFNEDKHIHTISPVHESNSEGLIGKSPAFKHLLSQVNQVAETNTAVLLTGETGVGKNQVARIIHNNSSRYKSKFITVQCSALTESLITSELFGHEKGAFTGAITRQIGRFEMADEGTIFLDEIGDLPLEVQARLLRVLQSKEFERVGGGKEILTSDFRLITATNRDLLQDIKEKRFREDLFYRINIFPIHIPPLRERKEDIPLLVDHFLNVYNERHKKKCIKISQGVMNKLMEYDWPGNVRELESVVERGVITSKEPYFQLPSLWGNDAEHSGLEKFLSLEENERRHIERALRKTLGKVHGPSGAAELLQINPFTLTSRINKLGIKKKSIVHESASDYSSSQMK